MRSPTTPNKQQPVFSPLIWYTDTMPDIFVNRRRVNAEKSLALASALFPSEEWVRKEAAVWVAKSRLAEEFRERDKWEREMSQVRILTSRGSAAYFLPESEKNEKPGKRYPDLVLDGTILEMKTVSGTIKTLGVEFKRGYKQGKSLLEANLPAGYFPREHSVFIHLISDLKAEAVKAKIAGELKNRPDQGNFLCLFEQSGELHSWTYAELRAIIGKR
jgi:hypothetical protein